MQATTSGERFMSLPECAKQLGVWPITLRRMVKRGDGPPAVKVGLRTLRFEREAFERWIQSEVKVR